MSPFRFDALLRNFAAGIDRRNFMRGLAATAGAAGFVAALPPLAGDAKKKKKRRKRKHKKQQQGCQTGQVKCDNTCVTGVCCPQTLCGSGNCGCGFAAEGDAFCAELVVVLCEGCTSSSDCPANRRCIDPDDCGACAPECGTV